MRRVARVSAARLLCLAVGGWLPLLLVLAAAPGMLRHGALPAHIVGAVTYITGSLRSVALRPLAGHGRRPGPAQRDTRAHPPDQRPARNADPGQEPERKRRRSPAAAPPHPGPGKDQGQLSTLEVRDITFAYGPYAEPVLADLTLTVPPGDHLAIVGPSGIGKSSLAGLLAGMLRPDKGEVLFNDQPVAGLERSWRILIPQEAYVFAGTLEENLTYLHAAATKTELDEAAAAIGLTPLVARLGGYGAAIAPAALSLGERRLIALTRAYLPPARVVILDEATCHLDPAAEERAEAAFARRDGTLIVIAHRISSARRARRILVPRRHPPPARRPLVSCWPALPCRGPRRAVGCGPAPRTGPQEDSPAARLDARSAPDGLSVGARGTDSDRRLRWQRQARTSPTSLARGSASRPSTLMPWAAGGAGWV